MTANSNTLDSVFQKQSIKQISKSNTRKRGLNTFMDSLSVLEHKRQNLGNGVGINFSATLRATHITVQAVQSKLSNSINSIAGPSSISNSQPQKIAGVVENQLNIKQKLLIQNIVQQSKIMQSLQPFIKLVDNNTPKLIDVSQQPQQEERKQLLPKQKLLIQNIVQQSKIMQSSSHNQGQQFIKLVDNDTTKLINASQQPQQEKRKQLLAKQKLLIQNIVQQSKIMQSSSHNQGQQFIKLVDNDTTKLMQSSSHNQGQQFIKLVDNDTTKLINASQQPQQEKRKQLLAKQKLLIQNIVQQSKIMQSSSHNQGQQFIKLVDNDTTKLMQSSSHNQGQQFIKLVDNDITKLINASQQPQQEKRKQLLAKQKLLIQNIVQQSSKNRKT